MFAVNWPLYPRKSLRNKSPGGHLPSIRHLKFESLECRSLLSVSPSFLLDQTHSIGPSFPAEIQIAIPAASKDSREPSLLPANYAYLIITSSALESSFQPLLTAKAARGLTTAIVTTDYIYANYAATESHASDPQGQAGINADEIRSFIRDSYLNHGTQWVLLGGDVEIIPQRGVYVDAGAGVTVADLPTDEYYACLNGSWNANGNGYWGELTDGTGGYDINLTPQIYVGRAPVSNATETVNFVNKTVQYETTTNPNAKQAILWGDQLDASNYGSGSCINIRDTVLPAAWKAQVIESYDAPGYTASTTDRINELNASPNIIEHLGHGSVTSNAHLSIDQVDGLTNSFPFFMYSQACDSGAFDYSDSIAEHYVTSAHGAFAVIMNSRLGWYDTSGGLDYSHIHAKAFMDEVLNHGTLHLGQANEAAKADMRALVGRTGYYRWIELGTNLLGDPETSMQIGNPITIPGVTITQSGGSTNVVESGAIDSYTIVLDTQPTANVTITLTPNSQQLNIDKTTLTFTTANWNVAHTITVSAVDDIIAQGPHTGTIAHQVASSDPKYNGLSVAVVTVNIADYVSTTRTWTGNAADNLWTTASNWLGGAAPHPTDSLVFPDGRQNRSTNDFPANTQFNSITFQNSTDFVLAGNPILLNPQGGIALTSSGSGFTQINLQITLGSDSTFAFNSGRVEIAGALDTQAHALTINNLGTQANSITGNIFGTGNIRSSGSGEIALANSQNYMGSITILSGRLDAGTIVSATAKINVFGNAVLNVKSIIADSLMIGGPAASSLPNLAITPPTVVASVVPTVVASVVPTVDPASTPTQPQTSQVQTKLPDPLMPSRPIAPRSFAAHAKRHFSRGDKGQKGHSTLSW